jgi:erythromycin esterase
VRRFIVVALFLGACSDAPTVTETPSATEAATLQWINAAAIPIKPDSGSNLTALTQAIGDATVIGIGESVPGSSELLTTKSQIIQHAITALGVRTVIIDGGLLAASGINHFLDPDDPQYLYQANATTGLGMICRWPWATDEFLKTVLAIRKFNIGRAVSDRVVFRGIDMQMTTHPRRDIDVLMSMLQGVDDGLRGYLAARLHDLYFYWNGETPGSQCKYSWMLRFESPAQQAKVIASVKAMYDTLVSSRSRIVQQTPDLSPEVYEKAVHSARLFVQWSLVETGSMLRGEALAENVEWVMANDLRGTRAIVLSSGAEVGRRTGSMGGALATRLGAVYLPIGLGASDGRFIAIVGDGVDFSASPSDIWFPSPGPLGESYESLLRLAAIPDFIVDLRGAPAGDVRDWLARERRLWRIESQFAPNQATSYAPPISLSATFDVFAWVRKSKPAVLLCVPLLNPGGIQSGPCPF